MIPYFGMKPAPRWLVLLLKFFFAFGMFLRFLGYFNPILALKWAGQAVLECAVRVVKELPEIPNQLLHEFTDPFDFDGEGLSGWTWAIVFAGFLMAAIA